MDGVIVEVCSWIKPEVELLLSVSFSLSEDIGVDCVWFPRWIPKEFKVYLVVPVALRR